MNVISRPILSALLSLIFVVLAITGIMMFFKIRLLSSETLHIWLGMAFVVAGVLHLIKNWKGFIGYFQKRSTLGALAFGCGVVALFILIPLVSPQDKGVNPKGQVFTAMMNTPLENLARFVNLDVEDMVIKLDEKAHIVASKHQSVREIAKANSKSNDEILQIVFLAKKVQ